MNVCAISVDQIYQISLTRLHGMYAWANNIRLPHVQISTIKSWEPPLSSNGFQFVYALAPPAIEDEKDKG